MTRDYRDQPYRTAQPKPQPNPLKQALWVMTAFIMGYSVSALYDVAKFTQLVQSVAYQIYGKKMPVKVAVQKPLVLPKPKFEFYTDLAKGEQADEALANSEPPEQQVQQAKAVLTSRLPAVQMGVAMQARPVSPKPIEQAQAAEDKQRYVLQLAAFSREDDAEKMKETLESKGHDAMIVTVQVNHMFWYRVMVGPFNSKGEAEDVQQALKVSGRTSGIIRKVAA